jgi:hypothetical protein
MHFSGIQMSGRAFQIGTSNFQMAARDVRMHDSGFQMHVQTKSMSVNIFQMRIHFLRMHFNLNPLSYKSDPANVKRKILSRKKCQKALNRYNMVYNVKQKNKLNKII